MEKFDLPYLLWKLMVKNDLTIKLNDGSVIVANPNNVSDEFLMYVFSNIIYSDLFNKPSNVEIDKSSYFEYEKDKYKVVENKSVMNEEFSESFYELIESSPEIKDDASIHEILNRLAGFLMDEKYPTYTSSEVMEYTSRETMSNFDLLISMIELTSRKNERNSRIANDIIRMLDVSSDNEINCPEDILRYYYGSKYSEDDSEYNKRNHLHENYSSVSYLISKVRTLENNVGYIIKQNQSKRLSM